MSSWFVTGDRGFGFKMAFDEAFRSYAPGQLLLRHVADHVAGLRPSLHFDTCTSAGAGACRSPWDDSRRSEEHTSELQSLLRISYAVLCLKKKTTHTTHLKS